MSDRDQGIKRLLQTHPADILHLALPDAAYVETLPTEIAELEALLAVFGARRVGPQTMLAIVRRALMSTSTG